MAHIIVVGSINMDVVAQTAIHPIPGQTVLGKNLRYIPGGKGSNQAIASARAGGQVRLVGKLGRDSFGDILTTFLKSESLDMTGIRYADNIPTGIALIVVSDASENTIVVVAGANADLSVADIDNLQVQAGDIVLAQLEIPISTVTYAMQRAKSHGGITILNPAPAIPCPPDLLAMIDYLVVNETELAFYAGETIGTLRHDDIIPIAKKARAFAGQTIIITLGADGVLCLTPDDMPIRIQGRAVKAVDSTGAGDCFVGTFATALAEGHPLTIALGFANTAAALSVQKIGASAGMPMRDEINTNFQDTSGI